MNEKWIGKEDCTSGSYVGSTCDEISIRRGGRLNAMKLYRFESRFGQEFYITDTEVLERIDHLLTKGESTEIYDYLYGLIIEKFGINDFLGNIERLIANERNKGRKEGKLRIQKEFRELLGF